MDLGRSGMLERFGGAFRMFIMDFGRSGTAVEFFV